MRSNAASAATARAFSLVIHPDVDLGRAALLLADTAAAPALNEALAHLSVSLFDEEDRVAAAAADVLSAALARLRQ